MTCSCGDNMEIGAETREEAVTKMKEMMTEDRISAHMAEKHPEEPVMTTEQVHFGIEKGLTEVM